MSDYQTELKEKIGKLYSDGYKTLDEIIPFTEGADLILVNKLLKEITTISKEDEGDLLLSKPQARNLTANLPLILPAPNPLASQWWFTLDSIEKLSDKIQNLDNSNSSAFIGAPTVGYYFSLCVNSNIGIFDIDADVLKSLALSKKVDLVNYNVYHDLPKKYKGKYTSVVIDPPWYKQDTKRFIQRGAELIKGDGFIFCLIPPRLTRPGIIDERNDIIKFIIDSNAQIVSIETDFVKYLVPLFEQYAYKNLDSEKLDPWRTGDLLVIKKNKDSIFEIKDSIKPDIVTSFSKDPISLRVFVRGKKDYKKQKKWFKEIIEFENNLSSRKYKSTEFSVWSTNKKAVKAKNSKIAIEILTLWQKGTSKNELKNSLTIEKLSKNEISLIVDEFDEIFGLWLEPNKSIRRSPEQIGKIQDKYHTPFAVPSAHRINQANYSSDGFRLEFQRDRDRVLWSSSFKKLANKCQVFPVNDDDSLRRRLTHSIEVMQLASTIAISFGLNRNLTEGGALVHDIGHTPFGHAGEFALNSVLNDIAPRLEGFNHYEHGVDVVVYLEDAYKSKSLGSMHGLNLTKETIECIIKHTFFRDNHELSQTELIKRTKHSFLDDSSCHLEGQSIRIADKVSYLISDLEDGIKIGAIKLEDIRSCSFFHRPPIDINPISGETLYERFISQRRSLLKVIMEDILQATDVRLSNINDPSEVREVKEYIVDFSPKLKKELSEIWHKLQVSILHKNTRVIEANLKASKIIYQLFYLYALTPELIEKNFVKYHLTLSDSYYLDFYKKKQKAEFVGISKEIISSLLLDKIIGKKMTAQSANWEIPIYNIILAKDYIASMTDNKALLEYRKHIGLNLD